VPFLRVIRDKRGYKTTYLMHWYREGSRQRTRILYIFRSPGGVRVGRQSLEPEVLRDIEARHPEISFDWKAVIGSQQVIDTAPDPRPLRRRRRGSDEDTPSGQAATSEPPRTRPREKPAQAAASRPPIPSTIEGSTPDEQIAFLARWYPIVRDRVPERTSDPARREALLALAERLNAATWIDADQIVAGLQQAGEALERLSRVFSRRRRRSKRPAPRPIRSESTVNSAEPSIGTDGSAHGDHAPTVAETDPSLADE